MIVRLLISEDLTNIKSEIDKTLASHLGGVIDITPRENFINHPDVLYFGADTKLGIEQARQIKKHFSLKPYLAKGKALVLEDAGKLTLEAQNALLKTLEEPPEEALLLLGARSQFDLLPTFFSRCQIVILDKPSVQESDCANTIEKLLSSSVESRFEYIEKLKERQEFLHTLVRYFRNLMITKIHGQKYQDRSKNVQTIEVKNFLKELLQGEQWAAQNVNIRAILEYLMLVMPRQK